MSLRTASPRAPTGEQPSGGDGSVLLATFDVPFDPQAADFAVHSAVDMGRLLVVANFVELELLPLSVVLGYDALDYPNDLADSLIAPVCLAASLGVRVERLRVRSTRRVEALVQVAREQGARLVVLGPDRSRVSKRLLAKATAAATEQLDCLVWAGTAADPG